MASAIPPAPIAASPPGIAPRRGPASDAAITARLNGGNSSPAVAGESSRSCCACSTHSSAIGVVVAVSTAATALGASTARRPSTRGSISGSRARRSTNTSAPSSTAAGTSARG